VVSPSALRANELQRSFENNGTVAEAVFFGKKFRRQYRSIEPVIERVADHPDRADWGGHPSFRRGICHSARLSWQAAD